MFGDFFNQRRCIHFGEDPVFNIVYLAVIGNTLEIGENNRFRFATDALSMTMLLVGLQWALDRFRPRRQPSLHAFTPAPRELRRPAEE
jgi:hypothetical protein